MVNKIKILVVSNTPWNDNNSFGNSFSNIWGIDQYEIANIYCQAGLPMSKSVSCFFRITEKEIIKKILGHQENSGKEVFQQETLDLNVQEEALVSMKTMAYLKNVRWQILFWVRDLIWATKGWKCKALDQFILNFNPDLIFQPVYYSSYINEIGLYAKKKTGVPMIGYMSDDNISFRQFSLSPLFWIDRMIKVPIVRKVVKYCELLYVITEKQRIEYDRLLGEKKCKVLFKGGNFKDPSPYKPNDIIQFAYTGNIGMGRWKILGHIASALEIINRNGLKAQLHIYSATPITNKILRYINRGDSSIFEGRVPVHQIKYIQEASDILVHVESFSLTERYKSRLSFSTKIVDYLEACRCILAVGWKKSGGIEYLMENGAALCATDIDDILPMIKKIVSSKSLIENYAYKGFSCGKKNHQIEQIRRMLHNDILDILKKGNNI